MSFIDLVGLIASIVLPFWNIPLIVRIIKRRSSHDISLSWVIGVWVCFLLMAPSAYLSKELIWKAFTTANLILFSAVLFFVIKYRKQQ